MEHSIVMLSCWFQCMWMNKSLFLVPYLIVLSRNIYKSLCMENGLSACYISCITKGEKVHHWNTASLHPQFTCNVDLSEFVSITFDLRISKINIEILCSDTTPIYTCNEAQNLTRKITNVFPLMVQDLELTAAVLKALWKRKMTSKTSRRFCV